MRLARQSLKNFRRQMKASEHLPGKEGMGGAEIGCPGELVFVEIGGVRRFMHFIGPRSTFNGRLTTLVGEEAWNRSSMRMKMLEEAMLFEEAFAVAYRLMMALHKDAACTCRDNAGRGKGTWTDGKQRLRLTALRELLQKCADFRHGQGSPIGLHPFFADAVRGGGCVQLDYDLDDAMSWPGKTVPDKL